MAQNLVDARMRALASATLMFSITAIGMGFGPQLVGICSDLLRVYAGTGEDSLRFALAISIVITGPWSIFHYLRAARTIRKEYKLINDL
jgi:hypothetical protein